MTADSTQAKLIVNTNLPNAGLGNMLLVWARAVVFADLNSLPMVPPRWNSLHIGPWLRGERCKRYYGGFFSGKHYSAIWPLVLAKISPNTVTHLNPTVAKIDLLAEEFANPKQHIFLFDVIPPWNDYFQDLKHHQPLLKKKLYEDIRPQLLTKILNKPAPQIGIHIRRGDYKKPEPQNDFVANRIVYTPLEWYINLLERIRQQAGIAVPATIFSDGHPEELAEILALPNVSMSPETSALSDLITMSRSKILIGSSHSSFSAWASYLGQCPTIWHSARHHLYEPIFTADLRNSVYEGSFDPFIDEALPKVLRANLEQRFDLVKAVSG